MKMVAGSSPVLTTNYKQFKNKRIMNNEKKLGQENAFPQFAEPYGSAPILEFGMSKRFYAACMVMQALLANPNIKRPNHKDEQGHVDFANVCYQYADELLKAEQL